MQNLFQAIEDMAPVLSQQVSIDEQNGRISVPVFSALSQAGFYRLFLPESLGGLEVDPVTTAKLVEAIAKFNAAAAWSVMVANAGAWWARCIPAETASQIFNDAPNTFFAGTFASPLKAERVDGGFRLNGRTPLCSNVHEAQWVGVSAIVMEKGALVVNNGMPEFRMIIMRAEDCKIIDTWTTIGMQATDSNDVMAENVFVPVAQTHIVSPQTPVSQYFTGALYKFPVMGINSCSLIIPVALALAANAIEELYKLTEKMPMGSVVSLKEKGSFQRKLGIAEATYRSAKTFLYSNLDSCWQKIKSGEEATLGDKAYLALTSAHCNKACVEVVDLVYGAAGTSGIYKRNNISRYFTDMQVVRQHGFSSESRFETAAQMLLGLPPDFMPALL